jgi:hypothetical protein
VAFHNLRRYDSHIIMRELGSVCNARGMKIKCIPKGMEDYLGFMIWLPKRPNRGGGGEGCPKAKRRRVSNEFTDDMAADGGDQELEVEPDVPGSSTTGALGRKRTAAAMGSGSLTSEGSQEQVLPEEDLMDLLGDNDVDEEEEGGNGGARWRLRFVDTCQYLMASMDDMVKGTKNFPHMRAHFPGDKVEMLLQKGVYPYEYMDKWDRFDETCLPPRSDFYSTLKEEEVSAMCGKRTRLRPWGTTMTYT